MSRDATTSHVGVPHVGELLHVLRACESFCVQARVLCHNQNTLEDTPYRCLCLNKQQARRNEI